MSGLNKVILVGNLGRDPEMHYTADGLAVTDFSLAVSDGKADIPQWFRVSCWRGLAETVNKHLAKGRQVYVEGRLYLKEFKGQDGKPHHALDVVAEKVVFLGSKPAETPENGDGAELAGDSPDAALDSDGDGLPIRPKAEAGVVAGGV